jgi:hypothetical protein
MMSVRRGFHWVLTLAFVHLLACAIPVGPASAADAESGIDRPGGDYKNFDLGPSIAGFGPCQSSCESDARCRTWTFVKSGVQGPKARCWLKDSVPSAVRSNCCVSGVSRPEKPIKHTKRGGETTAGPVASSDDLRAAILRDALTLLNQKVGGGQCTDFVSKVLADVHAKGGDFTHTDGDYIWGIKLNYPTERPQPGDIIQIYGGAKFTLQDPTGRRTGSWSTNDQHSAIIESVNGTVVNWIGQNSPYGSPVQRGKLDLGWRLDQGAFKFYRAVKG